MDKLLNNGQFWQKIDSLLLSLEYQKVVNKNSSHPHYQSLVFPVEYGHLCDGNDKFKKVCGAFMGSLKENSCDSLIVCCDLLLTQIDVKLLIGCTDDEKKSCLTFMNDITFQKAILIERSDAVPEWALNDNYE